MNESYMFNLSDFLVNAASQTTVPVQVPLSGRFRVNPAKDRLAGPFKLVFFDHEWWLIHPDVASQHRFPNLWCAELYEAIYEDGRTFVIPVTHPLSGREGWYETLNQAIQLARKQWVSIESDRTQDCYLIYPQGKTRLGAPSWLEGDFSDLVDLAFTDRTITTLAQARAKWPKATKRVICESLED
jgi:hypothetical protein